MVDVLPELLDMKKKSLKLGGREHIFCLLVKVRRTPGPVFLVTFDEDNDMTFFQ